MEQHKKLVRIFEDMAILYEILGKQHQFRARAYQNAALLLKNLPEDIRQYVAEDRLLEIEGIGKGIAQKIEEYFQTGTIRQYETLKKEVPADFIDLVNVKGLGPETLKKFHEELGITSKKDLVEALQDGRIASLEGFGAKKIENIRAGLQLKEASEKRIRLWDALVLGEVLLEELKKLPQVGKVALAGSVRRRKETAGDIDLLVTAKKTDWESIIDYFTSLEVVTNVLAKGETKASVEIENFHRQVDLRLVEENSWGAALVYFTGSKAHNVHLRQIAQQKSLKLNEYGVYPPQSEKSVGGKTEEEVYQALGLQWMPPEMREDLGEIALAVEGKIPTLVRWEDIKGDMHMHSHYSDGKHSLEEIVQYVKQHYHYEYIVITDHSKSTRIAGGMDEDGFAKQIKAIQQVNEQLGENFVKAGAEVDILPNGRMDLSDELLGRLDWVVGSIHAQFKKDNTERILRACENPYVHVIGHPTGRLIGMREGYPLQLEEVVKAAAATGTALEINAQPARMDLNDEAARMAREQGVPLVISTDSHTFENYQYLALGIAVARRAWCRPEDILNTQSWEAISRFKKNKRK